MGHAKVYLCTKFEVSRYTGSKFMNVGPKFTNFASELPTHSLGRILLSVTWECQVCTKFDVSSYTRSEFMKGGPKFTNLAAGPHHTPFGIICHP